MISMPKRQDSVPPGTCGNESKVSGILDQHSLNLTPLKSPDNGENTNASVSPTMVNGLSPKRQDE